MPIDLQKLKLRFNALLQDEKFVTDFEKWLENRDLHISGVAVINKTLYKVDFSYDPHREGRSMRCTYMKIIDAIDANELNSKIEDFINQRKTDLIQRWYYMKVIDIKRL